MPETQITREIQSYLDRLRRGDETARDGLIGVACERLRCLTRRMLRDYPGVHRWEQTDDVLQNAVLRLCRALSEVRPQSVREFLGLAALQIRRELRDLARQYYGPQGPGAHHGSQAGAGNPEHSTPQAVQGTDSTHNPARLPAWTEFHERVGALPAEEREVFELLWYQELGPAEAAEVLGSSESTVRRRWQAARRRLHDLLGGELPF